MQDLFKFFHNSYSDIMNSPFALECVGQDICDTGFFHSRPTGNRIHVFEYVTSGSGIVHTSSGTFFPKAGDSYFLRAGEMHEYSFSSGETMNKTFINVYDTPATTALITAYGLHNSMLLPNLNIIFYLNQIIEFSHNNCVDNNTIYEQNFITFIKLCQYINRMQFVHTEDSTPPDPIQNLKLYIDSHLDQKITLEKCAEITNFSTAQTTRNFYKAYGLTPHEYIDQQRIKMAKLMLQSTPYSIKEIAEQLGFSDQYYFIKFFKSKCSITPHQYRNNL